jgi:secreted trypsin-like serine protease
MILVFLGFLLNITPANAIIGGKPVVYDETIARSTVMLFGQTDTGGFTCTGTILNSQYILTAAHCVLRVKQMVIFFTNEAPGASFQSLINNKTNVRFAKQIQHNTDYPNTDLGQMYPHNDVALVRFDGGLPAGYKPVTILDPKLTPKYLVANQPVILAGFGKRSADDSDTGYLYKVTVPVQKVVAGKDAYVGADSNIACSGDSGGPAFIEVNGYLYQWGIASRSDCRTLSIYTPLKSNFYGKISSPVL